MRVRPIELAFLPERFFLDPNSSYGFARRDRRKTGQPGTYIFLWPRTFIYFTRAAKCLARNSSRLTENARNTLTSRQPKNSNLIAAQLVATTNYRTKIVRVFVELATWRTTLVARGVDVLGSKRTNVKQKKKKKKNSFPSVLVAASSAFFRHRGLTKLIGDDLLNETSLNF